ncbi:MAG: transposase, partial [Proteobacteria bacterium]|nr:transposase [Pseudomonadota bacterium]
MCAPIGRLPAPFEVPVRCTREPFDFSSPVTSIPPPSPSPCASDRPAFGTAPRHEFLHERADVAHVVRIDVGEYASTKMIRLPDSSDYRFYLTNIDPDSLDAHAVAQTYAARWQIELIFKE